MALAERVKRAVEGWLGGEHNAARLTGLSRTTIRRLGSGEVTDPRQSVLHALAEAVGTDPSWLMTGRGKEPIYERWSRLVDELEMPPAAHRTMLELPRTTVTVMLKALGWASTGQPTPSSAFAWALEQQIQAYELIFRSLIKKHGHDAVRRRLTAKNPLPSNGPGSPEAQVNIWRVLWRAAAEDATDGDGADDRGVALSV